MSLLNLASLILTPNAYKAGKLYSIVPSNGNGDMTVVRNTIATRENGSGIIEIVGNNIPRLDYDVAGGCPSILLEPQRTNLATNSDNFGVTVWAKKGLSTISNNTSISPDGTLNADTLTNASGALAWELGNGIQRDVSILASTTYTFSIYVKTLGSTTFTIGLRNQSSGAIVSSNIVPTSEWQRIKVSQTTTVNINIGILFGNTNGDISIWGAQLEQGAYPTSYIPTTTTALTRNTDTVEKTSVGTDILNASEGTFYVEISALFNDLTPRSITLSDGTDFNQIGIQFGNISNVIRLDAIGRTGVGTSANYRNNVSVSNTTTFHKVLIKWGSGGIFGFVDGVKYTLTLAAGTGTGIPAALNRIDFKAFWGGSIFYGQCKGLQIYKTALTDAECTSLTTL